MLTSLPLKTTRDWLILLEGTSKELVGSIVKLIFQVICKALQPEVNEELRRLCEAVALESACKVRHQIIEACEDKAPKMAALLDRAFDDITAVLALPLKYRKRFGTTNGVERLNQEIGHRERVIRIFPNDASVIRLMEALLMEQDEQWQTGRK